MMAVLGRWCPWRHQSKPSLSVLIDDQKRGHVRRLMTSGTSPTQYSPHQLIFANYEKSLYKNPDGNNSLRLAKWFMSYIPKQYFACSEQYRNSKNSFMQPTDFLTPILNFSDILLQELFQLYPELYIGLHLLTWNRCHGYV